VMADLGPLNAQLQAKTLRPLAVASRQRSPFLPDVPTLAEAGYPGNDFEIWLALYAPARTPAAVVNRVGGELAKYRATPAAREAFAKIGHESDGASGEVVRQRIAVEQKAFAPAAKAAGLGAKP
jgi:tripartite-type tricarboxylate transporter receptor subunit TctC